MNIYSVWIIIVTMGNEPEIQTCFELTLKSPLLTYLRFDRRLGHDQVVAEQ